MLVVASRLRKRHFGYAVAGLVLLQLIFNVAVVNGGMASQRLAPGAATSDLYPRWRGTRDLLKEQINPYSSAQTAEYERGFYGRIPEADEYPAAGRQAFFYPLHVTLVLLPLALLPFGIVKVVVTILLGVLMAWSVYAWSGLVGWPTTSLGRLYATALVATSLPFVFLVRLQQLTGLVLILLVAVGVLLSRRRYALAGALLSVTTIKPQLVWIPILILVLWALVDIRVRWRMLAGFALGSAAFGAWSIALQPNWVVEFLHQLRQYTTDNEVFTLTDVFPSVPIKVLAIAGVVMISAIVGVRRARECTDHDGVPDLLALGVVANVLLVPFLAYNAMLLIVPVLVVLQYTRNPSASIRLSARFADFLIAVAVLGSLAGSAWILVASDKIPLGIVAFALLVLPIPLWLALLNPSSKQFQVPSLSEPVAPRV